MSSPYHTSPACSMTLDDDQDKDAIKKEEGDESAIVEEDIYFLGYNLRGVSLSSAVGLYTIGIFVTYITMFIIQESVFKTSKFEHGGLLVVCTIPSICNIHIYFAFLHTHTL